jgi:hypothetical protein
MQMEKLCDSLRLRHVNIRYFFIFFIKQAKTTRLTRKKEISCIAPTGEMIPNFFSKPAQRGRMFQVFRDIVMGVKRHSYIQTLTSQGQERVENKAIERGKESK